MQQKVHIILNESDKGVIDAIKKIEGLAVTQIDYSLDTALYWLESQKDNIDIIVTSEYINLSTYDGTKSISKTEAFINKIRDIRLLMPKTKIIVFCAEERKLPENRDFLQSLVAIGIYDFQLITRLSPEILKNILFAPSRDISQVKEYLPGVILPKHTQEVDGYIDCGSEEKSKLFGGKLKKITDTVFTLKDRFKKETAKKQPIIPPDICERHYEHEEITHAPDLDYRNTPAPNKIINIYGYNLSSSYPDIVNFDSWDLLVKAATTIRPDIVLFESGQNIKDKIKSMDCITVVIGEPSDDTVDADYHFSTWNESIKTKVISPKEQPDPLTMLSGRITLENKVSELITSKTYFSLAVCDLDFFKTINDTYGHQVGDEVLKEFAVFLKSNIRRSDTAIRYGGEEFVIIFPDSEKKETMHIMQKLRQAWKGNNYNVTFSAGLASYPDDGKDIETLFSEADKAMYKAKKSGRDMVIAAGQEREETVVVLSKAPVRAWAVVGTAPRVGSTSFALLLANYLKNKDVEIIDAGGGASQWLRNTDLQIRKAPPYSIGPGITIIDCGTAVSEELMPLIEKMFIVTDLSCNALNLNNLIKINSSIYLVGNRGAPFEEIKSLAEMWGIEPLFSLKEDPAIRLSETKKTLPSFQKHKKIFSHIRRFVF